MVSLGKWECFSICKAKLEHHRQKEWTAEQTGRQYFSVHPSVKIKMWRLKPGKRGDVVLTRLRLGDYGLASCSKVLGKHPHGLCECGDLKTVHHVMFSWNKYRSERQ